MEHRLYDDSPYLEEWQTEVTGIAEKGGKYHVTLAATAFYPEGGGQLADRGTIDGIPVEHVYEESGAIYHVLPAAPQRRGVACRLDFGRRFDHMQQHTGQHLLSHVFEELCGAGTSSFHMGEEDVSIEISLPEVPPQAIKAVEGRANGLIYRDLRVRTHVVSPEEAARFPEVTPPPGAVAVRVVEIESVEFNACCGTHVSRLGEIGIVKVVRAERMGSTQTRIYFKCGNRALRDYQQKHDVAATLSRQYKAAEGELVPRVEAQAAQLKAARKEIEGLRMRLLDLEAAGLAKSATSALIHMSCDDRRFDEMSMLGKHLLKHGDFILLLVSRPDRRLIFACGKGFSLDCGRLFKEHLAAFNGKGGGSPNWATAAFAEMGDLGRFEEFLLRQVRGK